MKLFCCILFILMLVTFLGDLIIMKFVLSKLIDSLFTEQYNNTCSNSWLTTAWTSLSLSPL